MKKINITFFLLLFSLAALAQRHEPVNPQRDKLEFNGYTVQLLPARGGTYGYYIVRGKQLIVHQSFNPFTRLPIGLSKKEDAYKVAKWQIEQLRGARNLAYGGQFDQGKDLKLPQPLAQKLQMQGRYGPKINQRIPLKVAEQLQINISH